MEEKGNKKEEIIGDRQQFLPRFAPLSASEIFKRSADNAGRYKSPLSNIERATRRIRSRLEEMNHRMLGEPLKTYPIHTPPEWRTILFFLHKQGIISETVFTFPLIYTDEPPFITTSLQFIARLSATDGGSEKIIHCRGVAESFDEAASKVVGELLERYAFSHYRVRDFVRSSARNLHKSAKGSRVLDIFSLAGFADWQKKRFPEFNYNANSEFYWLKGRELTGNSPAWIPAQLIFLNYSTKKHGEPYLIHPSSNGAAGHFTKEEATLAAIYEYVQRDGFLLYWLRGKSPPRIDKDTITDKSILEIISRLERYNFSVILLNTRHELTIPSCVCVLVDNSESGSRYSIGGGASLDINSALRSSIFEALGMHRWSRGQDVFNINLEQYEPFLDNNIGQYERTLIWKNRFLWPHFENIFLGGPIESVSQILSGVPSNFPNAKEELNFVLSLFRRQGDGFEIYSYEASNPMLNTLGYHAIKVTIPALLPFYLKEPYAPLGARRLNTDKEKLNPLPHPFP